MYNSPVFSNQLLDEDVRWLWHSLALAENIFILDLFSKLFDIENSQKYVFNQNRIRLGG